MSIKGKQLKTLLGNRVPCSHCHGANRPENTKCAFCRKPISALSVVANSPKKNLTSAWEQHLGTPAATAYAAALAQTSKTSAGRKKSLREATNEPKLVKNSAKRERLPAPANRPTVFEFVVYGTPVPQGSMEKDKFGKLQHVKADELYQWRQAVEDAARDKYETAGWVPVDSAVIVEVVFTLPRPTSLPDVVVHPDTKPDTDKLQRGLGDSLSPAKGKKVVNKSRYFGKPRFRLLNEDSRIVRWVTEKTYPAPFHTHPGALWEPGARVRVIILDENPLPLPPPKR